MADALRTTQAAMGLHITSYSLIQPISLADTFQQNLFQQYIKTRLKKTSRGTFWREASYNLATTVWNMNLETLPQRASTTRILFDKLWEPWNTHHYADMPGTPTCLNCDGIDSLAHLLAECPHTAEVRDEMHRALDKLAHEATSDLTRNTIRILQTMTTRPDGANITIGLWQPEHRADFLQRLAPHCTTDSLTPLQQSEISSAILLTTRLLVTTSQIIIRHRIKQSKERTRPFGPRLNPTLPDPIWTQFLLNRKQAAKKKRTKKDKPPKPPSPALVAARAKTAREAEIRACTQAYTYDGPPPPPHQTPPPHHLNGRWMYLLSLDATAGQHRSTIST